MSGAVRSHVSCPHLYRYAASRTRPKKCLVHLAPGIHARVKFDFSEGGFVPGNILLQESEQRLRLLGAEVNALEVSDLNLSFALLLYGAKYEEKVPDIHSHLHAVCIGFPIVGGIDQLDIGLWRSAHKQAV